MSDLLLRLLAERRWLLADGATGTNLFAAGLRSGDAPELWNLERPDPVRDLAAAFVAAGSDIILTNTFGGTRNRLKLHGAENRVDEINRAGAGIARAVADAARRPVVVAGSMGPTGDLYEPLGPLSIAEGTAIFAEQATALAAGGVDVLWIETVSSIEELSAAVAGAGATGLPIVCTLSFDTNGCTMMGVTPARAADIVHGLSPRPLAYGANCGTGAADLMVALLGLRAAARPGDVLVAKSNCGVPEFVDGAVQYQGTPALMANYARLAFDAGARIIGGCCGTTPDHIRAMRTALETHEPGPVPDLDTVTQHLGPITAGAAARAGNEPPPTAAGGGPRRRRRSRT
ncbi:MAG: betaine--homocysteine S-methyltransferase [Alphaproteobacteria bacterium]|nr:MAG: betaine--homocysteine S-methyltransferase [Alphaproteobacteria bacterium]